MASKKKDKKSKKNKDKKGKEKLSKKQRNAEKEAKKLSRKGDGTFPDTLIVTKDSVDTKDGFTGYSGDDMSGLVEDGQTVAVYKLRRVSTVDIKRKITR
jgi:hypothetical protein